MNFANIVGHCNSWQFEQEDESDQDDELTQLELKVTCNKRLGHQRGLDQQVFQCAFEFDEEDENQSDTEEEFPDVIQ